MLKRSFYLLPDLPGRFAGGQVWVARDQDRANDSVSPVIIGGHDWAGGLGDRRAGQQPLRRHPRRRRGSAAWPTASASNLVMYALTGNYKGDQVQCRPSWKGWATRCSRPSPGSTSRPSSAALAAGRARRAGGAGAGRRPSGAGRAARRCGAAWSSPLLLLALANPRLVEETRETRPDIALLVVDRPTAPASATAPAQVEAARAAHAKPAPRRLPELEIRTVEVPEGGNQGTRLFTAMERGAGGDPPRPAGRRHRADRWAGARRARRPPPIEAPFHALLPGQPGEVDRRLRGHRGAGLRHRRPQRANARARSRISACRTRRRRRRAAVDPPRRRAAAHRERAGRPRAPHRHPDRARRPDRGGARGREPRPGEVSDLNNRAVVTSPACATGCACCWSSGEPHAGERTWRRLLKADPGGRPGAFHHPPPAGEGRPDADLNELALIAFPVRELFQVKLREFDLVVFDRFANRGILPPAYLATSPTTSRGGGALLMSVGPEFAGAGQPGRDAARRACCRPGPRRAGGGRGRAAPSGRWSPRSAPAIR